MFQFAILPLVLIVVTGSYLVYTASSANIQQSYENNSDQSLVTKQISGDADLIKDFNPSKGPKDARVVVVQFLDFECPGCAAVHPITNVISDKYNSNVRFVYKMFPLKNIHPNAESAAKSALAANIQGKYFEYADELFKNQISTTTNYQQKIYTENDIQVLAAQNVGLVMDQWTRDRESLAIENQVDTDFSDGINAQIPEALNQNNLSSIDSTPSFVYIKDGQIQYKTNGMSVDEFSEKLDLLLEN